MFIDLGFQKQKQTRVAPRSELDVRNPFGNTQTSIHACNLQHTCIPADTSHLTLT